MKTSLQMLDAMKLRIGVQSDYALAKHLGFTKSFLSAVRLGRAGFGDESGLIVAHTLNEPPEYILSLLHAERAKDANARKVWQGMAEKFARAIAALLVVIFPALQSHNADATPFDITLIHDAKTRSPDYLSINYTHNI